MEWKDATLYGRGNRERIPTIWELKVEGLRIVVHRIIHYPDWYLSCYELNIKDKCLYTENVEEAKNKAIKMIVERIKELDKAKEVLNNYIS